MTMKMIQIDPGCFTQPSNIVSLIAEPAYPGLAPEYSRPARLLIRLAETTGEWTTRVIHCATYEEAKGKAASIAEQINANPAPRAPPGNRTFPKNDQIDRGLRALDSVKHCDDQMTPEQAAHDRKMRETPPKDWTIAAFDDWCRILSLPRNNPKGN